MPPKPGPAALTFAYSGGLLFALSLGFFLYCYMVPFGSVSGNGAAAAAVASDVGLFSVFALHHSLLARTRFKSWVREHVGESMERSVYTWVASALFILVCAAWRPVDGLLYELRSPWSWIGYTMQGLGILLTALGSGAVDVLDLAGIRPALVARSGRPAPHVPLVTTGAYRLVRHPIYLAWALLVLGAPHMTATRLTFAVVSTLYLAVAIPLEERSLVDAFGEEYRSYQQTVRWRMLPFVY
jgi:protein-S-isoprenylcysteine O-methyltransferase Ste14